MNRHHPNDAYGTMPVTTQNSTAFPSKKKRTKREKEEAQYMFGACIGSVFRYDSICAGVCEMLFLRRTFPFFNPLNDKRRKNGLFGFGKSE